jgi:hypothetical protein
MAGTSAVADSANVSPAKATGVNSRPNLSAFGTGSFEVVETVAISRKINPRAVAIAGEMGCLRFGRVCGYSAWVLTDISGRCAEARRIDGKLFPAFTGKGVELAERKAHTIRGSQKNWPVGILPVLEYRNKFNIIALVEGGPDFFSALHFALLQNRMDIQPVAILGRGQAKHVFARIALSSFAAGALESTRMSIATAVGSTRLLFGRDSSNGSSVRSIYLVSTDFKKSMARQSRI